MERVSVEVWQQILLKVMETNDSPIFATSCTPYTFLAFTSLRFLDREERPPQPYLDYLAQRRRLQLVCRAWNEFVLFTSHRWLLLEDWSPMYELDSTTTTRTKGGVGPVEKLSTLINQHDLVTPNLSWASHILKRPVSQSPLRAYFLQLRVMPVPGHNPFDDFLVDTTVTQDLECTDTNTNTTLRLLSIVTPRDLNISISLSQISRTFTGLRSLFLCCVKAMPQQILSLVHLEVLCLYTAVETLLESIETWDTPALQHVSLGQITTPLTDLLTHSLGRYAHQIESLVLNNYAFYPTPLLDLPSGFWAQFSALRLLGIDHWTLNCEEWTGWSVVPPPTHPCRYLVSLSLEGPSVVWEVDKIRSRWTWNDGVRFVFGQTLSEEYHVMKNMRDGPSIANIEGTVGILPEL